MLVAMISVIRTALVVGLIPGPRAEAWLTPQTQVCLGIRRRSQAKEAALMVGMGSAPWMLLSVPPLLSNCGIGVGGTGLPALL